MGTVLYFGASLLPLVSSMALLTLRISDQIRAHVGRE